MKHRPEALDVSAEAVFYPEQLSVYLLVNFNRTNRPCGVHYSGRPGYRLRPHTAAVVSGLKACPDGVKVIA